MKLSTGAAAAAAAMAAVLAAGRLGAAQGARDPLTRFLEARGGESPRLYEEAAREVAAEAAAGRPVQQYALAAVAKEPGAPAAAKELPDEVRERYLELNRSRVRVLAQQKGEPLAWYLLYLETGTQTFLKRAADGDCPHALNELGARRLRGKNGSLSPEKTLKECFGLFARAAGKDDPNGHYNLGVCYLNGWGFRRDEPLAVDHLKRAADMDQPKALNLLGEMYREGRGVEQSAELAAKFFSQSAALGNAKGRYNYAMALQKGEGIDVNEARAAALLKEASDAGLVEAVDEYARCLFEGRGVDPDREAAVSLWQRAATKLKYAPSMDSLATCYRTGAGVATNEQWAVAWYKRAADFGHTGAMRHLADCYDIGTGGLRRDHYKANWWRTFANAEEGDRMARVWLGSHSLEER